MSELEQRVTELEAKLARGVGRFDIQELQRKLETSWLPDPKTFLLPGSGCDITDLDGRSTHARVYGPFVSIDPGVLATDAAITVTHNLDIQASQQIVLGSLLDGVTAQRASWQARNITANSFELVFYSAVAATHPLWSGVIAAID